MIVPQVILASGSPRRRELMKLLGLPFEVLPSGADETIDPGRPPHEVVMSLAERKARKIADQGHKALIIGADTLVVAGGEILGQPATREEAFDMLRLLSGTSHSVYTGISFLDTRSDNERSLNFYESTRVRFATLGDDEIERYIDGGSPFDKAGGYGIQDDGGALFVSGIEGDYYNVVGFPLQSIYQRLKQFAPELLQQEPADVQQNK